MDSGCFAQLYDIKSCPCCIQGHDPHIAILVLCHKKYDGEWDPSLGEVHREKVYANCRVSGVIGTAGVWRTKAIEDAGGRKDQTTVEDMDLAVRANLKGWKIAFVGDLERVSIWKKFHVIYDSMHLSELIMGLFLLYVAIYDMLLGNNHMFVYLLLQSGALFVVGVLYVGNSASA